MEKCLMLLKQYWLQTSVFSIGDTHTHIKLSTSIINSAFKLCVQKPISLLIFLLMCVAFYKRKPGLLWRRCLPSPCCPRLDQATARQQQCTSREFSLNSEEAEGIILLHQQGSKSLNLWRSSLAVLSFLFFSFSNSNKPPSGKTEICI